MANYATLKATIQQYIKQNGNNEITGNLLQQQLLAMITSLGAGYQFVGVATPSTNPGTPDENVFYLAATAGTYSNFGGIILLPGEISVLKYNGSWSRQRILDGYYYKYGSGLNDEQKAWLENNISGLFIFDPEFDENRSQYIVTYLMQNHSALGGNGYLGFQITVKDSSGNTIGTNNYRLLATSLSPNTLYEVLKDEPGNPRRLFIRTSGTYSWDSTERLSSGNLLYLSDIAIGRNVMPFVEQALQHSPDIEQLKTDVEDIKTFDTESVKTIVLRSEAGLTEQEIANIQDIYIDGNFDLPAGYKLGITYVGYNSDALGGSNCLGLQFMFYSGSTTGPGYINCWKTGANLLESNKIYEFDVVQQSGFGTQPVKIYIRTGQNYVWQTSVDLRAATPIFEVTNLGYGKNVKPFVLRAEKEIKEIKELIENNEKTFIVVNSAGLTDAQIALIKDIYVVGKFDIPVGNKLIVTYVGFNNSNLGGTGFLGLQFALFDGTTVTQQANCIFNAQSFEAGKLYKDSGKDALGILANVDAVYVRTGDNFQWINDDILAAATPIFEITKVGYGLNVQPFFDNQQKIHIVTVGKGTGYDYNTLTAATDAEPSGTIFIVFPGVYENECITAGTSKTLYIIGVDRDKCVIKNNLGEYQYAVIHIASGLLRNLTVIQEGTNPGLTSGAYGVHIDFNPGYNSTLRVENCHLQSNVPNTGGAGIGLRGGMHLTFKGCRFVSGTSGRALYLHDNDQDQFVGKELCTIEDCIIESPDQAIIIQGQGTPTRDFSVQQFYIEFCRNIIKGTVSFINWYADPGTITPDDYQGVKNLRLVATSWGNNKSVFNNPDLDD